VDKGNGCNGMTSKVNAGQTCQVKASTDKGKAFKAKALKGKALKDNEYITSHEGVAHLGERNLMVMHVMSRILMVMHVRMRHVNVIDAMV
jgi:hypothetical protein